MNITLHIPPELEGSLEAVAKQSGLEPERWASELIAGRLKQTPDTVPADGEVESDRLRQLFRRRQARVMALTSPAARVGEEAMLQQMIVDKLRKQGVTGGPRS